MSGAFGDEADRITKLAGALGKATEDASKKLLGSRAPVQTAVFGLQPDASAFLTELMGLIDDLRKSSWSDKEAGELLSQVSSSIGEDKVDISQLRAWVRAQPDKTANVLACLNANPPAGFKVHKVLSNVGSQKIVFRASHDRLKRDVVLKKLRGSKEEVARIRDRESWAHALQIKHANIIETHFEINSAGESFIVERLLPEVLDDEWRAKGTEDAGALLFDVASALVELHNKELVHGDVKPDNIGHEQGRFILLDFGICRKANEFTDAEATGSLRTRAPELFSEGKHSHKSDVWALGATLAKVLTGRFPLVEPGETPPKDAAGRKQFQETIAERAKDAPSRTETVLAGVLDASLREILRKMLEVDPTKRTDAKKILDAMREQLPHTIGERADSRVHVRLTPIDHARQLIANAPDAKTIRMMPSKRRESWIETLDRLLTQLPKDHQLQTAIKTLRANFDVI